MDKTAAASLMQELLKEHPELLQDFTGNSSLPPPVPATVTIRTSKDLLERADSLVPKFKDTRKIPFRGQKLTRSDVFRAALEKGVKELEKLV